MSGKGRATKTSTPAKTATTTPSKTGILYPVPNFSSPAGPSRSQRSSSIISSSSCEDNLSDQQGGDITDRVDKYASQFLFAMFSLNPKEDEEATRLRDALCQGVLSPIEALSKSSIPSDKAAAERILDCLDRQFPGSDDAFQGFKDCFRGSCTGEPDEDNIPAIMNEKAAAQRASLVQSALLLVSMFILKY